MENVITLGKLIGLLILFYHFLLSILFLKTPKIRGMTSLALCGNHFSSLVAGESFEKELKSQYCKQYPYWDVKGRSHTYVHSVIIIGAYLLV